MVWVFWADEKMKINEGAFGSRYIESQLHIGENQLCVRQPTSDLALQDLLIGVENVIVGDGDRLNIWRCGFKSGKIVVPGRGSFVLIVHHSTRRVNMWLPPAPFRPPTEHGLPQPLFLGVVTRHPFT